MSNQTELRVPITSYLHHSFAQMLPASLARHMLKMELLVPPAAQVPRVNFDQVN